MSFLPDNIKMIRLLSGKSQADFGAVMNVTKGQQYSYEKGNAIPDGVYLRKVADFAGITIEQLKYDKLTESIIQVKDPETKEMEFTLIPTTNGQGVSELQARLKELELKVTQLEVENNLLKEINDKLINVNR